MMHKIIELGLLAMLVSLIVALVGLIVGAFLNSMAIAIFFIYGVIGFGFAFLVCLAAMFIEGVR